MNLPWEQQMADRGNPAGRSLPTIVPSRDPVAAAATAGQVTPPAGQRRWTGNGDPDCSMLWGMDESDRRDVSRR